MGLQYHFVLPPTGAADAGIVAEMFDDVKAYVDTLTPSGSAAPIDAQYVTLATNVTLTKERVLTAGTGITLTDNGAGSTIVVSLTNGIGVTDIHGTANQVTVSATTGSVTLSLPQDIATASSPTFSELLLSGGSSSADLTIKLHDSHTGFYADGSGSLIVVVGNGSNVQVGEWLASDSSYTSTGPLRTGTLVLKSPNAGAGHPTVTITPQSSFTSYALVMPPDDGSPNQYLTTDGSGNLSWTNAAGTGTVDTGTANRLAYYPASTAEVAAHSAITAARALISDVNGLPTHATTTATELGYVNGVTSAIQTQFSGKEPSITTLSIAKGGTNSGTALSNGKIIVSSGGSLVESSLGLSGTALTGLVSVNGSFLGLGKNRVVNGDMQFDQRNEGASVALVSNTNTYCCDTFFGFNRGKTALWGMQRLTAGPPSPFAYYERITITTPDGSVASDAEYVISTRIEGTNFVDTAFGTASATSLTLSFWVRSSLTGTFGVGFESAASDANIGQYTISAANTWEYKTITISGDTAGTWSFGEGQVGLKVLFDLGSGSDFAGTAGSWTTASEKNHVTGNTRVVGTNGATWDVTGIQLELGSTATSFEWKPYNDQIRNVQRFYEKSYYLGTVAGAATSTGKIQLSFGQTGTTTVESTFHRFHVQKAGVPTMTFYDEAGTSGKWKWRNTTGTATSRTINLDDNLKTGFYVYQTVALEYIGFGHFVAEVNL